MAANRTFSDAGQLAAALTAAAERVGPAIAAAVGTEATALRDRIRSQASGRPGPNVITGAYRASWQVEVHPTGTGATAVVGTFAPQARRLELGFVGADALGRIYAQPPFPHVAPAMAQTRAEFAQRVAQAVMGVL
ncbi:hypothetical protein [Streptomyces sp. NPDC001404]|uniref:hypothetical protein n=1 Tax=Streptomyces sp. NPDC001404 TaxID=3364571 RepID=UPI003681F1B6